MKMSQKVKESERKDCRINHHANISRDLSAFVPNFFKVLVEISFWIEKK